MKRLTLIMVVVLLMGSSVGGTPTHTVSAEITNVKVFINDIEATDVETISTGTPGTLIPSVTKIPTVINVGDIITSDDEVKVTCDVLASATISDPALYSRAVVDGSIKLTEAGWDSGTLPWSLTDEAGPEETAYKSYNNADVYREGTPPGIGGYTATINSNARVLTSETGEWGSWTEFDYVLATTQIKFTVVAELQDEPPVIELIGPAEMTLECGVDSYTEEGAIVRDDIDDPAPLLVIGGDLVDTSTCGTYVVTYDATDTGGNQATQVTRTVIVQDTTAPVITGPEDDVHIVYLNPGETVAVVDLNQIVTVTDGGSGVDTVVFNPSLSTFPVGDTLVTCTATDIAGKQATYTFTVTVEEQDVLDFFDDAVAAGTLEGRGTLPAVAQFRLDLMRTLLEIGDVLIQEGWINSARFWLELAYDFTDGQPQPPDLVEGPAAPELATRIQALIDSL